MEFYLIYVVLGCIAGLLAGLMGIGGGIVIVPVLAYLFQAQGMVEAHVMHMALGTSLATIVVTSISAVIEHHRRGAVNWSQLLWFAPGLMLGASLGGVIADGLSSLLLQRLFGSFEIAVGLYMFLGLAARQQLNQMISRGELAFSGALVGSVSSMLGIGGGTMTVPYLVWRGCAMTDAVATSAAGGFFIAVFGAFTYLVMGLDAAMLPDMATGYLYWPAFLGICLTTLVFAPLGAKLAHRMPVVRLKQLFAVVLIMIGIAMLLK